MTTLCIVGNGADKFTPRTRVLAILAIANAIAEWRPTVVISGESPVGGIDEWARKTARLAGVAFEPYAPNVDRWDGEQQAGPNKIGFKQRNQMMADACDIAVSIVVGAYPDTYEGRRWKGCYHCNRAARKDSEFAVGWHVKSGACWTLLRAREKGSLVQWVIINEGGTT